MICNRDGGEVGELDMDEKWERLRFGVSIFASVVLPLKLTIFALFFFFKNTEGYCLLT